MSEINDHSSDAGSDSNWPIDAAFEGLFHDRVVFENVPDQYVKGENVTAFFTILHDIKVNADEDQIGLLRVGSSNIKECLAYAPVQFNPSAASGAVRHGTAVFPTASLPATDDEFYQFCYILSKSKTLGSSIPFQLNCEPDDIDLLSNTPVRKTRSDGLIALADQDDDGLVVIHSKSVLTEEKIRRENRQLLEDNRRLELLKEECQVKLEVAEAKQKEHIAKLNNEMQALLAGQKTANQEVLSRQKAETKLRIEYDACRSLCSQYQSEASQFADRCRMLEETQAKIANEGSQTRNQLAVQSQFTKDQATQIVDLERRLMQADELSKSSNQRQTTLERQVRDLRLTAEKHQISMQAQLDEFARLTTQREDQINALESKNQLLKDELASANTDKECLALESKHNKDFVQDLQQQMYQLEEQHREKRESMESELESLRAVLNEKQSDTHVYATLKASYTEIEKRCVKHQKSELEAKRRMSDYQKFINDLKREIDDLTERLAAGAEEYRTLFRKYTALEHSAKLNEEQEQIEPLLTTTDTNEEEIESVLRNTYDNQQEDDIESVLHNTYDNRQEHEVEEDERRTMRAPSMRSSLDEVDGEVRQCPVCHWEFPGEMTVEGKREHVEHHFQ